jgi:hypothetical protein
LKEIALHFQEEINLKKDLIEEEKRLYLLTQDLQEKEYTLFKLSNEKNTQQKVKELRGYMSRINEQISMLKNSIDMKIQQQTELLKRREYIHTQVTFYNKDPLGNAVNMNYQYYILCLNNLSLEYKKYQNNNLIKINEIKVNKFVNQVKLRDEVLKNIDGELKKRNLNVKANENLKQLTDLNIEQSLILPSINNDVSSMILDDPKQIMKSQNTINKSICRSANSKKNLNYEGYNNPFIIKEKKRFKTKTSAIMDKSNKNQLSEIKLNLLNELYPNSKVKYLTSDKQSSMSDKVIEFKAPNILNRDKSNISILSTHSSPSKHNNNNSSRLEREMDKKSKNILKRNIISRYRNSPYISQIIK